MPDWLRDFLSLPVLEDKDQQNKTFLLNTTLLVILFLIVTVTPLLAVIRGPMPALGAGVVLTGVVVITRWLLRRGQLRAASWLISLSLLLGAGFVLYRSGGLRGIGALSLTTILIFGGLLLRDRSAIAVLTVVAIFVGAALFLGEMYGFLAYRPQPLLLRNLLLFVTFLATFGLMLAFTMSTLEMTMNRARRSEQAAKEATEHLEAMNVALEARVASRTRALQLSAEVSRRLSTILNQDELVEAVVDQLQQTFNYYHVHIYLLDEQHKRLRMVGGTGEAGRIMLERGHAIELGRGLVGRAAVTNLPVLVPDVAADPEWLPNPLLPETRAEIAVPISRAEEVMGVLDVQHNITDGLTGEDLELIQTITNQISVAIQNARLYEASRAINTSRSYEEILVTLRNFTVLGHADHLSLNYFDRPWTDGEQPELIYVLARKTRLPLTELDSEYAFVAFPGSRQLDSDDPVLIEDVANSPAIDGPLRRLLQKMEAASTIFIPLVAGGQRLGFVHAVYRRPRTFPQSEMQRLSTLARQAAVAIQGFHLLEEAQRRARRERILNQVGASVRSVTDVELILKTAARQLGQALGREAFVYLGDGDPESEAQTGNRSTNGSSPEQAVHPSAQGDS